MTGISELQTSICDDGKHIKFPVRGIPGTYCTLGSTVPPVPCTFPVSVLALKVWRAEHQLEISCCLEVTSPLAATKF